MTWKASLCLGLACALTVAGAKPKSKPKPGAPAASFNLDVPLAGSSAELLDPATGKGRAVGPLLESLTDYQATAFPDGRVLLTGGSLTGSATQWFDPATRRFTPGPPMTQPRQGHAALLLKDGTLLLVGGTEAKSAAESLAPGASRFQALAGSTTFSLSAEAALLPDGKVFLVDGASGQCSLWDGKKGFSSQGTLARPRIFFRATALSDGRVLITGGWPSGQKVKGRAPRAATEVLPVECFNPRWGTLSTWKALPRTRARHQAELLADGRVCLWAGYGADATSTCEAMELLDPGKESVTLAGQLPLGGNPLPARAQGLFLAERGGEVLTAASPLALLTPTAAPRGRLANAYLAPTLVPLPDGKVLVLGTPSWGVPVDRWDPRTRHGAVVGSMRAQAENLGLAPDGRVVVLGPVVDLLDPRTGALKPLGWREDLGAFLKTVKPHQVLAGPVPPFAPGQARKEYRVVALDKTRALVIGGTPEGSLEPSGAMELWDTKAKALAPLPELKTRRAFPEQAKGQAQGAMKLPDGSVLIWGPGKE